MLSREQQYLKIKQKLDSYHLPTIFPLQTIPLLSKIFNLLDNEKSKNKQLHSNQLNFQSLGTSSNFQPDYISQSIKFLQKSIRLSYQQTLHQNNQLHLDIVCLKQQLQTARHCIDKFVIQKSDNKKQITQILRFRNQRENQLWNQMEKYKNKYNQLVGFICEYDGMGKEFLKSQGLGRKVVQEYENNKVSNSNKMTEGNNINQSQSNQKDYQTRNQSNKKTQNRNKSIHKKKRVPLEQINNGLSLQQKINELAYKLKNREHQISRLHEKMSYNGVDITMNKVLRGFQVQLNRKKIIQLQRKLQLSQNQYNTIKKKFQDFQKTGGRYEALRKQVEKCHSIIKQLKQENTKLRRIHKQIEFDLKKQRKIVNNQKQQVENVKVNMKVKKFMDEKTIEELKKKVEFYQKELQMKQRDNNNGKNKKKNNKNKRVVKKQEKVSLNDNNYENSQQQQQAKYQINDVKGILKERPEKIPEQSSQNSKQNLQKLQNELKILYEQIRLKDESIQNLQKIIDFLMKQRDSFIKLSKNPENAKYFQQFLRIYEQNNKNICNEQNNESKINHQQQNQQVKQQIQRSNQTIQTLQKDFTNKVQQNKYLNSMINQLLTQKKFFQHHSAKLQKQFKQKQFFYLQTISKLQIAVEKKLKQKNHLIKQMKLIKENSQQLKQQLQSQKSRLNQSIGLGQVEKDQIINLRKKINVLEEKVMKYVERIEENYEVIEKLKEDKVQLNEEIQRLKYLNEVKGN